MDIQTIEKLAEELGIKDALPKIEVGRGTLDSVLPKLKKEGINHVGMVMDTKTKLAAGDLLKSKLTAGHLDVCAIELVENQNGQVLAEEQTLVQVFKETPADCELLLAVGSGTIHDITRFCAYKMKIPFISIPTAASVDGFTSKGAPLIIRGVKQTVQTSAPTAVFADLNILMEAPPEMTAAGYGDILGKYTSLLDWQISRWIGKEPFNSTAYQLTLSSLQSCVEHTEEIAAGSEEGMKILVHSLIESGLVMLLLDFSRPASGGEHHLSHYWEMELIKKNQPQVLHGAKVGVAAIIIAELYKAWAESYSPKAFFNEDHDLVRYWDEIQDALRQLPEPDELKRLLLKMGGPVTPGELRLSDELVEESLNEAYHLRDRCTGLRLINQLKSKQVTYPFQPSLSLISILKPMN
ncbi:sn-glycerol-1-phosphate dehydrogenase [Halobacillus salinarum]|uniref:Sn-glycerol-1-phosphate dehydrogenase n=1 Tax=Halobacillus salinarum TaxID=2932257 RepID=A0ABY4EGD6_9BACI|nr:sn-glycerol-1-phosphate dehydrogenase [Halobacillus salinarum]UOQ43201.1 sn-glycerol-1-phosphate dehydrogenase [Halobacillus salinarum]